MRCLRRIPLEGAFNARDLGGYPTASGRSTRWGALVRSDSPARLAPGDWATLRRMGIETLVDLRSDFEAETSPVMPPEPMRYVHVSLMRQVDELPRESLRPGSADALDPAEAERMIKSMTVAYGEAVRSNASACASAMGAVLDGLGRGGVLFFCSAGKDRTGIVAALCLYLCGVPKEDIVADYMVTAVYNKGGIDRRLRAEYAASMVDERMMDLALSSDAKTMEGLVDDLDEMDVASMLDEAGFTRDDQGRLEALLCEEIG
ncbi:MAG: tyrosine-protein phosphatase [Atopobiaceae bacterium]|nr:tyrosine-protein phosphatase [Atopobiaceae bacterium]